MKKVIFLLQFALLCTLGMAQEGTAVYNRLKMKYKDVYYFYPPYYSIIQGGYIGIADENGNIIIPPTKYRSAIWDNIDKCFKVSYPDGSIGVVDETGKEVFISSIYTGVSWERDDKNSFFIVHVGKKIGVIDKNGTEIVAPTSKYSGISWRKEGNCFWVYNGDKMGILDKTGKEIVAPSKYTYVNWEKDENYFKVEIGNKVGILNGNGVEIIAPNKYTDVRWYRDKNYFRVEIGNKEGILDGNGVEIIAPNKYTDVTYIDGADPYYLIEQGKLKGIADTNGKIVLKPMKCTNVVWNGLDNYCMVYNGDKMGIFDENGREMVAPNKYTRVYWYRNDNYFKVKIGDKEGILDGNGVEIIAPNKYTYVHFFDNMYFIVKIGEKVGIFNEKGQEIVEPTTKYTDFLWKEGDKYIYAINANKTGIVDVNGNEILPAIYEKANLIIIEEKTTQKSAFILKDKGKKGLLDEKGNVIAPVIYDEIKAPSESLCAAQKSGKWGFISIEDGSVVVPFEYDKVSSFQDGVAKVTKNGKVQLLPNPLRAVAAATNNRPKANGRAVSTYPQPNSEVDKNIPVGKKANPNTFAFIIANENYPAAKVPYALNDGWVFEEYCKKTLGIKAENVKLFEDATGGNIMACVEQMKQVAKAYDGEASIIFYYAGHAFPDEEKSTAYLLPIDGDSKDPATGYSLERLYKELNSVPAKRVVCFLDACFSGATREDEMLMTGRGVAIKVKDEIPQGNMVVMTSATGAETAHQYEEKGHGLFTYFLLQKLKETKGDVSLEDLSAYIIKNVKRKSVLINNKIQTPTVIPSPSMLQTWRSVKL